MVDARRRILRCLSCCALAALALPLAATAQVGPLGSEFRVNTYTPGIQDDVAVAADADGDFVAVWVSYDQDGSGKGIFARRFSSAGTAIAGEFQVNSYTTGGQLQASVAVDAEGDFVIAWSGVETDGFSGAFARRFSSDGAFLGGEFLLNTYTVGTQGRVVIAGEPDGDFVAVWHSDQDGSLNGVFGRAFTSAGDALSSEFQVNTFTTLHQSVPSISMDAEGDFVVAWQSDYQDGAGYGIFARRFGVSTAIPLDIDGNGLTDALTDGLLVLRYLFGFTGNALIAGAVGEDCNRCDASGILMYLAGLDG